MIIPKQSKYLKKHRKMRGRVAFPLLVLMKDNNKLQLPSVGEDLEFLLLRGQKEHQELLWLQSGK